MRARMLLVGLAAWLLLLLVAAITASAQSDAPPDDQSGDQPPAGPSLQPSDHAPLVCDAATPGFRYVEVRGSGFDAWAKQRLVGNLVELRARVVAKSDSGPREQDRRLSQ